MIAAGSADDSTSAPSKVPATVLFVDEHGWDCFFQLGAGLRRAGLRAVRVTTGAPSRSAGLCFARTIRIEGASELVRLGELLVDERISDVQVVDALATETFAALEDVTPDARQSRWDARAASVDKFLVSKRLSEQGLTVPATMGAAGADASAVIEVLGLPVVHKLRVGSGGSGITFVDSASALRQLCEQGGHDDLHFFERFVEGRHLQFGAIVDGGRTVEAVTFESLGRATSNGPASRVLELDDEPLAATGQRIAAVLGIDGFLNVEVIRDADGQDWIHDVNPRVWGSFAAFRATGSDLLGSYVHWLEGSPHPIRRSPRGGIRLDVFPGAIDELRSSSGVARDALGFLRAVTPYLRWIGPRYVVYETNQHFRWKRGTARPDRKVAPNS